MFNNTLQVSAAFHSCGWLCPQKRTAEEKVSPYNTPYWLEHAEKKPSTGAGASRYQTTTLFLVIDPTEKALWAVKPVLKLLCQRTGRKTGCIWKSSTRFVPHLGLV